MKTMGQFMFFAGLLGMLFFGKVFPIGSFVGSIRGEVVNAGKVSDREAGMLGSGFIMVAGAILMSRREEPA